ncbi:DUF4114 domain-containing protein [Dolichospermum sp. ST_sed3]|nr:DUF4114 domain-containing protein [Dolichospermum sp. ST_sed10]MDD1441838.1 DUF4114 domain-containing protein [Dolichospermum sp. ST_sed3]
MGVTCPDLHGNFKDDFYKVYIIKLGFRIVKYRTNVNNDPQVYFPYLGVNSDGVDHIRLLGNNTLGFEDLPNGGDFDDNDIIVKLNFTQIV